MRGLRQMVGVVALVALMVGQAVAGERGGRRGAGKEPAVSEYDLMVRELKLTEQQQADLKVKIKAREDAVAAWNTANAEKLKAAEDAAKAARTGADPAAKKQAAENLKALHAQCDEATAEASAAVLAVLTPEQKKAWEAFKLYETVAGRYKKLTLTEEQQAKIKAACAAAWKELEENQGDDKSAKKARTEINNKLRWAIEVVILTPEQREAVPTKGGRKAGAAAPAPAP
ncbi:MAG TPA: Spy/CpxP family protein refolding chaperone [Planctomycetota bacterium]|nr:Spy/CpxP family protein refolding chaperone [Planctomycetota bacterium]